MASSPVSRLVGHLLLPAVLLAAAFAVLLGPALAVPRSEWRSLLPRVWAKVTCPAGNRDPSTDCPARDPAAAVAAVAEVLAGAASARRGIGPEAAREIARRLDADGDAIVTKCEALPFACSSDGAGEGGLISLLDAYRRSRQMAREQNPEGTAW